MYRSQEGADRPHCSVRERGNGREGRGEVEGNKGAKFLHTGGAKGLSFCTQEGQRG